MRLVAYAGKYTPLPVIVPMPDKSPSSAVQEGGPNKSPASEHRLSLRAPPQTKEFAYSVF